MDLFDQSGINGYLANIVRISISYSAKKISKQLGQLRCSSNSLCYIFMHSKFTSRLRSQKVNCLPLHPPGVVTGIISVLWRDRLTAMLLILCRSALNASFLVNLELSPHILCKSPRGTARHQNRFSPLFPVNCQVMCSSAL